ncbi:MAG TPA: LysR family transcriptional regulator [Methylomirabilota bacterium]|nr:LysR family transcriptional regulator [Methylomirabilota bacterium]
MRAPRTKTTDANPRGAGAPANLQAAAIKTKVWMELSGRFVIGDGGLKLLLGVLEHGSLLGAAREIGWSYRHAWGYLKQAEAALQAPLTTARPGKGASRGMALTETGRLVLEQLMAVRNRIDDAVGPSGPTKGDIAARGRRPQHRAAAGQSLTARGDWRTRR